jgi:hypothetical protein
MSRSCRANTQGVTLEETRTHLNEAGRMVLQANREFAEQELKGRNVTGEPFELTPM